MYLLGTVVEELLHVVAQLRATHDGVVAEHHTLVFQQGGVGDELHLRHKVATALVAGRKRAGPCGRVLQHGTLVGYSTALGIAQGHTHARVGNAAHQVGLDIVLLAHHLSVALAYHLRVDALVARCRESIVDPEERADLAALEGWLQHLDAACRQFHDLAGPQVAHGLEAQVGETRRLGGNGVGIALRHISLGGLRSAVLPSNHYRCPAQEVAGGDDAVLGQDEHGAGAFDFLVDPVDAVDERVAHVDEQGHQLRLVNLVGTHLAEVHAQGEQLVGNLALVVDLRHRTHRIAPQVRVHDDGLRVGVADDADALVAAEVVEFVLELRAEVVAFQRVDGAAEAALLVERYKTCTLGA